VIAMNIPEITIITCTYNHELFIEDCILSVLKQTYENWEQIIIDDGSVDNTTDIIRKYDDERILLITQKNRGITRLAETYNHALHLAKGKYIAILEGDDYWPEDKLENQLKIIKCNDADFVWGRAEWVDIIGSRVRVSPSDMNVYVEYDNLKYLENLLLGNFIPAVTVVVKKTKLLSIGGFRQPTNMVTIDYPTWIECVQSGKIMFTEKIVGFWRRHPSQMSTSRQHELLVNSMIFSFEYFALLPAEIKKEINLNKSSIENHWRKHISESAFHEGRKKLIRKQWIEAKHEFIFSFKYGISFLKLKSIIGILGAILKCNIEYIVILFRKDPIEMNEMKI
jgi:glycosyltransferase involved in cell wall biosynthesis